MKGANWILAGVLTLLGFSGCNRFGEDEYGTPHADYTVKGTVVNRATGRPVKGIRVSYINPEQVIAMYGVPPAEYNERLSDSTDGAGSFSITTDMLEENPVPVYVLDMDGGENGGFFGAESLEVDFSGAAHSGKRSGWYEGEYTVTLKVELTEKQADE
jgi:putative lipoprotein (rSAM/lipoprotein system)